MSKSVAPCKNKLTLTNQGMAKFQRLDFSHLRSIL